MSRSFPVSTSFLSFCCSATGRVGELPSSNHPHVSDGAESDPLPLRGAARVSGQGPVQTGHPLFPLRRSGREFLFEYTTLLYCLCMMDGFVFYIIKKT